MFQSRNRVWAVHAASQRYSVLSAIVVFQSRNRVWAVHAPMPRMASLFRTVFQSRNRVWAVHASLPAMCQEVLDQFQSRNRVWAVHAAGARGGHYRGVEVSISQSSLGGSRRINPTPWVAVHPVSISQSSLGGSRTSARSSSVSVGEFQSRNRVWAVHAVVNVTAPTVTTAPVSISQSSLGGSRPLSVYDLIEVVSLFQSRNRVWAVHALRLLAVIAPRERVSISQSSLGGSRADAANGIRHFQNSVSISQSSLGGSRRRIHRAPTRVHRGFNLAIEFGRFTRTS